MVQENAKKALQYWNKDGVFLYEKAPKWVAGLVEKSFSTDSVHLVADDSRQDDLVRKLREIAVGTFEAEYIDDYQLLDYLKNEVHLHECKQCGTDYESFDKTAGFCSMRCLNEKASDELKRWID